MNRFNLIILFMLALLSFLMLEACRSWLPSLHPLLYILLGSLSFLLLFLAFDRYLWRWLGFAKAKQFHGEWQGRLNTSRTDSSEVELVRVLIYQNWLSSRVVFIAPHSSSTSLVAIFFPDKNGQTALAYIYWSKPYKGKEKIVPTHVGLNVFYPVADEKLTGYFHHLEADGQGVKLTHGQVVLTRKAY